MRRLMKWFFYAANFLQLDLYPLFATFSYSLFFGHTKPFLFSFTNFSIKLNLFLEIFIFSIQFLIYQSLSRRFQFDSCNVFASK